MKNAAYTGKLHLRHHFVGFPRFFHLFCDFALSSFRDPQRILPGEVPRRIADALDSIQRHFAQPHHLRKWPAAVGLTSFNAPYDNSRSSCHTAANASAAASTSSSLVYQPKLNRTQPRPISGRTPIAASVGDKCVAPE